MKYDQTGIEQIRQEIEVTKRKLDGLVGKDKPQDIAKDWHYYQDRMDSNALSLRLSTLNGELKNAKVVKPHNKPGCVDIGDIVGVYDARTKDAYQVRLTGKFAVEMDTEPEEISLNSPLGEAIYGKKVGEHAVFKVSGTKMDIAITSITKDASKPGSDGRPDDGKN